MEDSEHDHLIWKDRSGSLEIRVRGELDDGRSAFNELLAAGNGDNRPHPLPGEKV
jgi:hypothetical protein